MCMTCMALQRCMPHRAAADALWPGGLLSDCRGGQRASSSHCVVAWRWSLPPRREIRSAPIDSWLENLRFPAASGTHTSLQFWFPLWCECGSVRGLLIPFERIVSSKPVHAPKAGALDTGDRYKQVCCTSTFLMKPCLRQ